MLRGSFLNKLVDVTCLDLDCFIVIAVGDWIPTQYSSIGIVLGRKCNTIGTGEPRYMIVIHSFSSALDLAHRRRVSICFLCCK